MELKTGHIDFKEIAEIYNKISDGKKCLRFSDTYNTINFNVNIIKMNEKMFKVMIGHDDNWMAFFIMSSSKNSEYHIKIRHPITSVLKKFYINNFSIINDDKYEQTKMFLLLSGAF